MLHSGVGSRLVKQLDFSSYAQPVSFDEAKPYLKALYPRNVATVLLTFIIAATIIVVLFIPVLTQASTALSAIFVLGGLLIIAMVPFSLYRKAVSQAKLARMAIANGMATRFNVPDPNYNGLYFQHGDDRKLLELLEVTENGSLIGTYKYTTGSGRSRSVHTLCFARTTLTRRLPHIVLDNVKNNFWKFTNLPTIFSSDQKLSLEGDFNNTFTLYAPKEYERDALYVFTPDVMLAFIESGYDIDAEIVDNHLYVYFDGHYSLENEQFLGSVYNIIQKLGHEVEQQSNYYSDERVASHAINAVGTQGQRLKSGFPWVLALIAGYILFNLFIRMINN
jgi:hypothetical protein